MVTNRKKRKFRKFTILNIDKRWIDCRTLTKIDYFKLSAACASPIAVYTCFAAVKSNRI